MYIFAYTGIFNHKFKLSNNKRDTSWASNEKEE